MKALVSRLSRYFLPIIAIIGLAGTASASTGENSGLILSVQPFNTSGSTIGDFAITLGSKQGYLWKTLTTLCPGHGYAYVNVTDPNYATIIKNIAAAITFKSTAYVYWATDANGLCHITELYY